MSLSDVKHHAPFLRSDATSRFVLTLYNGCEALRLRARA